MGDQSKPHSSRHGRGRIWRDLRPRATPDDYRNAVDGWTEYDLPTHDRQGRPYPAIRPMDYPADIVIRRLRGVKGSRPQWSARCPAHADSRPSLSLTELEDGTLLVHCFADCPVEDVMKEIGLTERQLYVSEDARGYGDRRGEIKAGPYSADEEPVGDPVIDYTHFTRIAKNCQVSRRKLRELAQELGLSVDSLLALQVGHNGDNWVFVERDSMKRATGIVYRRPDGSRFCAAGSKRGLSIPIDHKAVSCGRIFLPEGATDTAAVHSVGEFAVGRPAASSSKLATKWLVELLRSYADHETVIVVGDRDKKKNGKRTGLDAAKKLAEHLNTVLKQDVRWALPRRGYKDVREQIIAGEWDRGLVFKE
jgi:hypothetical protein